MMRMPFYAYQNQSPETAERPRLSVMTALAVGATIFLLPAFSEGKNAGLNLLLFFGILYVLRGMGILAWMSRSREMTFMLVAVAVFALPFIGALALGIGLGDKWLDLRSRAQSKPL